MGKKILKKTLKVLKKGRKKLKKSIKKDTSLVGRAKSFGNKAVKSYK